VCIYIYIYIQGYSQVPPGFRKLTAQQPRQARQKEAYQWIENLSKILSNLTAARYVRVVYFWGLLTNASRTRSTVSADGPGRPLRFAAHRQPLCWNFMYLSRIVLSVGGSVWYMIRNLRCTVTIDSVLANSKTQTQNPFLFTVNTIFRHDYPLAVEPASTPRPLVQNKLGEILYPLICFCLPCLSWLLRSRVRKSRREL